MELITALANTGHVEVDQLSTNDELREWWRALETHGSTGPISPGSEEDVEAVRATRDVIRGLGLRNNGIDAAVDVSVLTAMPLRFEINDHPDIAVMGPINLPRHVVSRALAELLTSSGNPGWHRLRACPGPGCGWVFVDRSRSGSRRWCQMSDCGNRAKGAAFRARRRDTR